MATATLTALKFDSPEGAERLKDLLLRLQRQELIQIRDAVAITWPQEKKRPRIIEMTNLAGLGAINGAFWGLLFGLIFFLPILGMAYGLAFGALGGALMDIGVNNEFIESMRQKVTKGTSALILLTGEVTPDKVIEAVQKQNIRFDVISTNLSNEQERKLQEAFAP